MKRSFFFLAKVSQGKCGMKDCLESAVARISQQQGEASVDLSLCQEHYERWQQNHRFAKIINIWETKLKGE